MMQEALIGEIAKSYLTPYCEVQEIFYITYSRALIELLRCWMNPFEYVLASALTKGSYFTHLRCTFTHLFEGGM